MLYMRYFSGNGAREVKPVAEDPVNYKAELAKGFKSIRYKTNTYRPWSNGLYAFLIDGVWQPVTRQYLYGLVGYIGLASSAMNDFEVYCQKNTNCTYLPEALSPLADEYVNTDGYNEVTVDVDKILDEA
jgi:hypothetical protein